MLEDILRQIAEERVTRNKTLIGEIPYELREEYRQMNRMKDHFEEDVELRKKQYELEFERRMESEFDERHNQVKRQHERVWNHIYQAYGLNPNKRYQIINGKIYAENGDNA